ncbi:MAG: hypothetical protein ABSE42_02425 [Bryobacteraceae bacterium]|jgi:hypothetical protein
MRQFSAVAFVAMALASFANAQATRTWVSGVGDDANPCSRTAPCKTFAGAISKTAAGGEIDALDPGGFGALTITKSIVIDGGGNLAGVLVAGTNGITVAAGATDTVILRNIWFDGANATGVTGVSFISGGLLVVEKCLIFGFSQSDINVAPSGGGNVSVQDVSMTGGVTGIKIGGAGSGIGGTVLATLNRISIKGATNGVDGEYGLTNITNSVITQNTGVAVLSGGTGTVSVTNNLLVGNQVAVEAGTGSTIRLSNNDVYDNQTGFACGGGTLASAANNRKAGNVGGSLPVCAPTVTMTVQ